MENWDLVSNERSQGQGEILPQAPSKIGTVEGPFIRERDTSRRKQMCQRPALMESLARFDDVDEITSAIRAFAESWPRRCRHRLIPCHLFVTFPVPPRNLTL